MTFQSIGQAAAKVVDPWAWYFAALKNPDEIGKSLLASESDPQQGYYRTRFKGGQWQPVAIFYPEGSTELVGYRDNREVRDLNELWTHCLRHPISYEAYQKAIAGGGFDDEPPPPVGHNSGETDPFEAIRIELAGEAELLGAFLKQPVKTQADADRIGIWAKRLGDISKRADNQRVVEKEPHLKASRDVDDKWRDVIADAKDWAAKAKKHVEAFLIAEKRKAEEIARKAREEAETLRKMAEDATREAKDERDLNERNELLRQAQEADKAAEVRNASAGRTGARVSIRTEKRGEIVDYDKLVMALKDRAEIRELVQSLANRAAKSGFDLPGMKIVEIEKVV